MGRQVKGQDAKLVIRDSIDGSVSEDLLIQDMEFTWEVDMTSEGYLGQTTEEKDSIFKGCAGTLNVHFPKGAGGVRALVVLQQILVSIKNRDANRRTYTLIATLNIGNTPSRVRFSDIVWGTYKKAVGGRGDNIAGSFEWSSEDGVIQP